MIGRVVPASSQNVFVPIRPVIPMVYGDDLLVSQYKLFGGFDKIAVGYGRAEAKVAVSGVDPRA